MPGENLSRQVWNWQTRFTYNYRPAALVRGYVLKALTSSPVGELNPGLTVPEERANTSVPRYLPGVPGSRCRRGVLGS